MEVHFTPEEAAKLSKIAEREGVGAEELVKDAALHLIEGEARFRAAVQKGLDQADRGEFIEEEEMDARVREMFGT
jgi:predicted transcriptional regulator